MYKPEYYVHNIDIEYPAPRVQSGESLIADPGVVNLISAPYLHVRGPLEIYHEIFLMSLSSFCLFKEGETVN